MRKTEATRVADLLTAVTEWMGRGARQPITRKAWLVGSGLALAYVGAGAAFGMVALSYGWR